jgi:hypothetical protein
MRTNKQQTTMKVKILTICSGLGLLAGLPHAAAQSVGDANTLSYQGMLSRPASEASATYDLMLTVFASNSGGTPIAGPITNTAVAVNSNGLFSTTMNFGSNVFAGGSYFLEVGVRTNGGGAFTTLSPRQPITSTPQSTFALNAGAVGGQSAANIALGTVAANSATTADVPGTLMARDTNGAVEVDQLVVGANNLVVATPPMWPPPHLTLSSSIFLPTNGAICLPFPATIYSGTNTLLVEEGNTWLGLGAGSGAFVGAHDVGVGDWVLSAHTTGLHNTAIGEVALQFDTTGSNNTAGGYGALRNNTTGSNNKADGYEALYFNTTGLGNTAEGAQALYFNTSGTLNTANGLWALFNNNTGGNNNAIGYHAMYYNTIGSLNTADGVHALSSNDSGSNNVAVGFFSLQNADASFNTAAGSQALGSITSGSNNIALGYQAGFSLTSSESGNIDIGNPGAAGDNNTIRIGSVNNTTTTNIVANTYIAGIWDATVASNALTVVIDSSGHLGTSPSSGSGNGNFTSTNISLGGLPPCPSQAGVLNLPFTSYNAGVLAGAITMGGCNQLFVHAYGGDDFFGGIGAGNVTMSGGDNTGLGFNSLHANTTGNENTAVGSQSLASNTSGIENVAVGFDALQFNTTGFGNTASGWESLSRNTNGWYNTGIGLWALRVNTSGNNNTAEGYDALGGTSTGSMNTAVGVHASLNNTSGSNNVAVGADSLNNVQTGVNDIAVGYQAGINLVGSDTGNIDIGNTGVGGDTNTIRIGTINNPTVGSNIVANTFIAGIWGVPLGAGTPVVVDSTGHLGVQPSSARYKQDIQDIANSSEALLSLRPVSFEYKNDAARTPQFGLIAEEVEKLDPRLVLRDGQHEIVGVRYEAVNAMLLNEFLKEHRKVAAQSDEIQSLKQTLAALTEAVKQLKANQ